MEFLGFVDGIKDVDSAWAIASGTGDPRATVVADVFHMIRGGGAVDDLLKIPGDRLACFHINDLPAEPDPLTQKDEDRVMVGEGIADLPRVIANLRTIGYRGPLSLELFNHEPVGAGPLDGHPPWDRAHPRAGRGLNGSPAPAVVSGPAPGRPSTRPRRAAGSGAPGRGARRTGRVPA